MSKKTRDYVKTPFYVLMNRDQVIGPVVHLDNPNNTFVCIYGFSEQIIYNQFAERAAQTLTPHPLDKSFLSNLVEATNSNQYKETSQHLVILDATSPVEPIILAAKLSTVLNSHLDEEKQLPIEHRLLFDSESNEYRINVTQLKIHA